MEHPEKALFDEVRGLRTDLETSKERILQVEKDYEEKVVYLERRCQIDERCEEKLQEWKVKLNNESKLTFSLNEKECVYFKSTFTKNLYPVNKNLIQENEDYIYLEISKRYFKGLIDIVRKGHQNFENPPKTINFSNCLPKKLAEEPNFIMCLREYFDNNVFLEIVKDFGLNFSYLTEKSNEELLESFTIEGEYSSLTQHFVKNVKELAKKDNKKGLLVGYSGNIMVTLSEAVRTNRIYLKPFNSDINSWSPTNGASYAVIYGSLDGSKWESLTTMPSNWGNSSLNYLCEINFTRMMTFKYLKFLSNASSYMSISYLAIKPEK